MRRIASVFAGRRNDKLDPPKPAGAPEPSQSKTHLMPAQTSKKSARLFGSVSRITVSTSHPLPPLEQGHSSSSSSTGSASLRTPEEDHASALPARTPSGRRPWIPWIGSKKPQISESAVLPHAPYWSSTPLQVDSIHPPSSKPHITLNDQVESEADTSESSSSESEHVPAPEPVSGPALSPVEFVVALTTNNVSQAFSPPPLLHSPNSALFPRSSNSLRQLSYRDSLESEMHKKQLLRRLQRQSLAPADQRLVAAFGSRSSSQAERRTLLQPDEAARLDLRHLEAHSRGLKNWIARPYFEERMAVWAPEEETGEIKRSAVKGSGFGVWALDISEALEELAGGFEVAHPESPVAVDTWEPPSSASSSSSQLSASMLPAVAKQVPYRALPSPLRNGHESPEDHPLPVLSAPSSSRAISPQLDSSSAAPAPRRGVRFAESVEKDDQVPLDYVLRHQRKREERAKFLQQQQERRRFEEEKRTHEAERVKWNQERAQWQREKQALEDSKKQKMYAEEVIAARARRETLHGVNSYGPTGSANRESDRRRDSYTRPVYDSRRGSDASSLQPPPRLRNDSSSSRQGSAPKSDNGSPRASSRPASTFSTHSFSSAEDPTRINRGSRRGSMISESSQMSGYPMYPYGWNNIPPVPSLPQIPMIPVYPTFPSMPMIPMMPQYAMDMPLLPPAPPFMLQQHGSPRSRNSSPSRSRPLQHTHSSDRIHQSSSGSFKGHERQRSASDDVSRGRAPVPRLTSRLDERRTGRPSVPHSNSLDTAGLSPSASSPQNRPNASRRRTAFS